MSLPVAIQLYSVRNTLKDDVEGTLKALKEMGYDGVVQIIGLLWSGKNEIVSN